MKRAGIITYWDTKDNYGTVLQNFALQTFLRKYSIEPILIRQNILREKIISIKKRKRKKNLFAYGKYVLLFPVKKLYKYYLNKNNNKRNFEEFIEKEILYTEKIYTKFDQIKKEQSNYDLYIAGSDQIWNFSSLDIEYIKESLKVLLFDFAPDSAKKISCAASFGSCNFSESINIYVANRLQKFDFLSVREKSGLEYCNSIGVEDVYLQSDPTMLFNYKFYQSLCTNKEEKKYVLLYLLNNTSEFSIFKLKIWAKRKGMKVIYINGNTDSHKINLYKKYYPTIYEWLSLIKNAEYVFTNSFHGTIFSIIFNKSFMSIKQTKSFSKQNTRIDSLFTEFNLYDRYFENNFDKVNNKINWIYVNDRLRNIEKNSPWVKYINSLTKNS